jgi:uncharacterized cupredoxin-like copper-binding protein
MHAIKIVSYSCGLLTGTEGSVTYRNEQDVRFTIYWNNPYIGSNGYSVSSTSGDYKMAYTGGSGDNSTIKVFLTPTVTPVVFNAFITSDSQAWRLESGDPNSSANRAPWESRNANVVKAINAVADSNGADFLILNGDLTEFGREVMRDSFYDVYNSLTLPYLYGLGNHDYQNNVGDCTEGLDVSYNACARWSVDAMAAAMKDYRYIEPYHFSSDWNYDSYSGSLAYSWDYGDFHFVQLQNYPTYEIYLDHYAASARNIRPSMDWLQNDLRAAKERGKASILNLHDGTDHFIKESTEAELERFRSLIDDYRVLAVFDGHSHSYGISNQNKTSKVFGNAVVYNTGALFLGDFAQVSFSDYCLTVSVYGGRNGVPNKLETYPKICDDYNYSINAGSVGRVPAGEKITVPFTFNAGSSTAEYGSRIHAIAPPHTKIADMSHRSPETVSIAPDGKSADVIAGANGTSWETSRTLTLIGDAESEANETVTGSLQYFSQDGTPASKAQFSVTFYSVYFTGGNDQVTPGEKVDVSYVMHTFFSKKIPGSSVRITAPPHTRITDVKHTTSESLSITGDGKIAVITAGKSLDPWPFSGRITLSVDKDIPLGTSHYGTLQYISSAGTPDLEYNYTIFAWGAYGVFQKNEVYTSPGGTVVIPVIASDLPAGAGSAIRADVNSPVPEMRIIDMSHDSSEQVTISPDKSIAEVKSTDSSHPWAADRTITVVVDDNKFPDDALSNYVGVFGLLEFSGSNGERAEPGIMYVVVYDDSKYLIRQGETPNVSPGDTVTVTFNFPNVNFPAVTGSSIQLEAPKNCRIVDMSHDEWERLTISNDGKTAKVVSDGSEPWNSSRTVTLSIDHDAPLSAWLIGTMKYVNGANVSGTSMPLIVTTY